MSRRLLQRFSWLHDGIEHVEIAIGLLSGYDQVDDFVHGLFQLRVGVAGQGIAGRLDPLGEVGIPEVVGLVGLAGLPVKPEGADPVGAEALLVFHRQSHLAVGLLADLEESRGQ